VILLLAIALLHSFYLADASQSLDGDGRAADRRTMKTARRRLHPPTGQEATMREHRHPQATVTETDQLDNFNPGSALEDLRDEIVRIEALADAAMRAMEFMPRASTPDERRANGRIYALVSILADEIAAAFEKGDAMVVRLGEQLAAHRNAKAARRG